MATNKESVDLILHLKRNDKTYLSFTCELGKDKVELVEYFPNGRIKAVHQIGLEELLDYLRIVKTGKDLEALSVYWCDTCGYEPPKDKIPKHGANWRRCTICGTGKLHWDRRSDAVDDAQEQQGKDGGQPADRVDQVVPEKGAE